MKIKYCISFLFLFNFIISNAQSNYYYYYKGEKVFLTLDKKSLSISVFDNFHEQSLNDIGLKKYSLEDDNSLNTFSSIKYA